MVIGGGKEKIGGGNLLQENPFQEQQVDTEPFGAFSKVAIKHDGEGEALEDKLLINLEIRPLPLFLRKIVALALSL